MKKIKYVIFDDAVAVILPDTVGHDSIQVGYKKATSAGFVDIGDKRASGFIPVYVYGESVGLKLKSKESDANLICQTLGEEWMNTRTQRFVSAYLPEPKD